MPQLSFTSIVAGTLTAYGGAAALLAMAWGIAVGVHSGATFNDVARTTLKVGAGTVVAICLLLSYLFGGYVAGRMARRSGALNGLCVFALGVVLAAVIGATLNWSGAGTSISSALHNAGAPTTWREWRDVGTIGGIAALVAMLIGSLFGGAVGERWHSKLVSRALDPSIGPEAAMARQAVDRAAEAVDAHVAGEARFAKSDPASATTTRTGSGPAGGRLISEPLGADWHDEQVDPDSGATLTVDTPASAS
jgi:hypothetical protein